MCEQMQFPGFETRFQEEYYQGFSVGNKWDVNWIPGGPFVYSGKNREESSEANKRWREGFTDGLNLLISESPHFAEWWDQNKGKSLYTTPLNQVRYMPVNFVFLDLEGVIIGEWGEREILWNNFPKIKNVLHRLGNVSLGLMSWAVHDEWDKDVFSHELQGVIETELNIKFESIWSMEDWVRVSKQNNKRDLYKGGKLDTLVKCKKAFHDWPVYLLDDNVETCDYENFHLIKI